MAGRWSLSEFFVSNLFFLRLLVFPSSLPNGRWVYFLSIGLVNSFFLFFLLDNTCWQQLELVLNRLLMFLLRGRHNLLNSEGKLREKGRIKREKKELLPHLFLLTFSLSFLLFA